MNQTNMGFEHYLSRFENETIACSQYALTKLGVDRSRCVLKIEDYTIPCAPYQLAFKRTILVTSLSKQELTFFQRFRNSLVGLSLEFQVPGRQDSLKLFLRGSLSGIGPMKGRENVGLIVVDFKTTPEDLVSIIGGYLEGQEKLLALHEEYGKQTVRITPDTAKTMGYNMYAVAMKGGGNRRIQLFSLSSREMEYLEAAAASEGMPGEELQFQLFFRKFRIQLSGAVVQTSRLASGVLKTTVALPFTPELVEILDEYWVKNRADARKTET